MQFRPTQTQQCMNNSFVLNFVELFEFFRQMTFQNIQVGGGGLDSVAGQVDRNPKRDQQD